MQQTKTLLQHNMDTITYPALYSQVAEQIVASYPSLPSNKYTLYTPVLMEGVIVHRTWQYDGCLVFTSISCSLPEAQCA